MGLIAVCPETMVILRSSSGLRVQPGFLLLLVNASGGGVEAGAARTVKPLFVVLAVAVGMVVICMMIRGVIRVGAGFDSGVCYLCIVISINAKIGIGAAVRFAWMVLWCVTVVGRGVSVSSHAVPR